MPPVRCADCGFLAMREFETRRLVEVEAKQRVKWSLPRVTGHSPFQGVPTCAVAAARLDLEADRPDRPADVDDTIHKDRDCAGFAPWRPGLSPKDHQDMIAAQQLQDFQAAQRETERKWQEGQRAAERAWQEAQDQRTHRREVLLGVFAAVMGLVGALIGAALSRGP